MTRKTWLTIAVAAAVTATPAARAQQDGRAAQLEQLEAQLPGTLLNDPTSLAWQRQGENVSVRSQADAAIPGGSAANRYTVRRAGPEPYSAQASVPLLQEIGKGETVTVGFWARTERAETDDGQGRLGVRIQLNQDPWPGFADTELTLGPEWKWHEISAVATTDVPRGSGFLIFNLAGARQTIDIGQTIVVKGAPSIAGAGGGTSPPAAAVEIPEPLRDTKGRLIARPDRRNWGHSGPPGAFTELPDQAIWLGNATRFAVAEKGANRWDVATAIPLEESIEAGDRLLIAIAARAESAGTEDGNAVVGIRVQSSEPPYAGFADNLFKVGPNWQLVRVATTATETIPAGQAMVALHFAEAPQTVVIGPVYVFKTDE